MIPDYPIHQLYSIIETLKVEEKVQYSFDNFKNDNFSHICFYYFQLICALLWMMHVRDNFSQSYRKIQDNFIFSQSSRKRNWANYTHDAVYKDLLKWAVNLYPFQSFFQNDVLEHIIINVVLELQPSEEITEYLATVFFNHDTLSTNIKKLLLELLEEWKTINVNSVEGNLFSQEEGSELNENEKIDEDSKIIFQKALQNNISNAENNSKNDSMKLKSLYDIFLLKCQRQREKTDRFQTLLGTSTYKNSYISSTLDDAYIVSLFSFELDDSYVEFLEMFLDINAFKYLSQDNADRLNIPLIPLYAENIREQIYQKNKSLFKKRSQFIFPIISNLWKNYCWKEEHKNSNKQTRKIFKPKSSSTPQIKNVKNLQKDFSNKEIIREGSNLELSSTNSKEFHQQQINLFLQYVDSKFKEMEDKIDWLCYWAKNYPICSLENDILNERPKLKVEIHPIQILYALYHLKTNFKFVKHVDEKNDDKNEKYIEETLIHNSEMIDSKIVSDSNSHLSEKTNDNFKSDFCTYVEPTKEVNLCTSLKQSIVSLKEQLNNWRVKRSEIANNVHLKLNEALPKNMNSISSEDVRDKLPNNEAVPMQRLMQNDVYSFQDQNENDIHYSSSRVSKFLSLPKVKTQEFETAVNSENTSSLTSVTKLPSGSGTSSTNEGNKLSSYSNQPVVYPTTSKLTSKANKNGKCLKRVNFTRYEDLFADRNNKLPRTYTNIGIQTSVNEENEFSNRENRHAVREMLTSTVQGTFCQELRNMAEQMGLSFIAGAIGCISVQSQQSRTYLSNANTQTEIIDANVSNSSCKNQTKNTNHNVAEQISLQRKTDEHITMNKESSEIRVSSNLKLNSNHNRTQKDIGHNLIGIKSLDDCKNDKLFHNVRHSHRSLHAVEEEMDSGKDVTPDTLDELSGIEISIDSCFDNTTTEKDPTFSFKLEEYVNKIISFPHVLTYDKSVDKTCFQNKNHQFLTINQKFKENNNFCYQLLNIPNKQPKEELFKLPLKSQYELISHWNLNATTEKKNSDIRSMLPDLLKSKSVKNKNIPLLQYSENNYGPLLYLEEEQNHKFITQKNLKNKQNENLPMNYVQDYLLKKNKLAKKFERRTKHNSGSSSESNSDRSELPSKTKDVTHDHSKMKEKTLKILSSDTILKQLQQHSHFHSTQTSQTYADIQYNVVSKLKLDTKKADTALTTSRSEVKNIETLTDENCFFGNDKTTREFGIQTSLIFNKSENYDKIVEKPLLDDDENRKVYENPITDNESQKILQENIQREIENKQKQVNSLNFKNILDHLIDENLSSDGELVQLLENSKQNIEKIDPELKNEPRLNNENKFETETDKTQILEDNHVENNNNCKPDLKSISVNTENEFQVEIKHNESLEFNEIESSKNHNLKTSKDNENNHQTLIKEEQMLENSEREKSECKVKTQNENFSFHGNNLLQRNTVENQMKEEIKITESNGREKNLCDVGDQLTQELLVGNQDYVRRYLISHDSDKGKYKISAKESLNHQLLKMQEKLDAIEKVSDTMKEEINSAQKAVSSMENLNHFYLSEKISTATYIDKIKSVVLPNKEHRKRNWLFSEIKFPEETNKISPVVDTITEETSSSVIHDKHTKDEKNTEMHKVPQVFPRTEMNKIDPRREKQLDNFDKRTKSAIALLNELAEDKHILQIKEAQLTRNTEKKLSSNEHKLTKYQSYKKSSNSRSSIKRNRMPYKTARETNYPYFLNNNIPKIFTNKIKCIKNKKSENLKSKCTSANLGDTFIIKNNEDEDFASIQQKAYQSLRKLYGSKHIPLSAQIKYLKTSEKPKPTAKFNVEDQKNTPKKVIANSNKSAGIVIEDKNQSITSKNDKSGSSDNLSLWSVPEDIKQILYGSNCENVELSYTSKEEISSLIEDEISIKSDISSLNEKY
ncbi:uncharacterized protein LOC111612919 [Centruroides sculpturatus]|uniref:uncharacterized protein LOC111612919 n=1 Tax=Centruroides sculpturatus TaxID=218467 RepID=UPI000C6E7042|nr:uncharacterized protein LOC111612919 [Centruroides sculpturatus]